MNGSDNDAFATMISKVNSPPAELAMMFTMLNRLDDNITKLADRIEVQNEVRRQKEAEQDSRLSAHEIRLHALETGGREDRDEAFKRASIVVSVISVLIAVAAVLVTIFHH